jgi:Mg-chelatase subunit ChlD
MMMGRFRMLVLGMIPLALSLAALVVLTTFAPPTGQQAVPPASRCTVGLQKWVDPSSLLLGDTAQVSLVMTHTCPADIYPIDLIFLADVSNSMTRAKGGDSDPGKPEEPTSDPPGRETPPPGGTPDPGGADGGKPSDDPPGCGTSSPGPGPDPGPGPGGPLGALSAWLDTDQPPDPGPGPEPTKDPGDGSKEEDIEPAGSEDLVRDVQRTIRDILDRPEIARDAQSGKLRIGLAQFNDRGTKLVDLTGQIQKVRTRVGSLRGSGHSRIDLGMRTTQTMFIQKDAQGRVIRDDDRVKILVVMSDGLFCRKDFRTAGRAADEIKVMTMAAGRGADMRKLRQLASETEFVLRLDDVKEFMHLYDQVLPKGRPVTIDTVTVRDELSANMELIPSSVQPPTVTLTGQLLEWTVAPVPPAITFTYQVRPLVTGVISVSVAASAAWTDSELRSGTAPFPDVQIEVIAPTPTATPTSTPTDTPTPTPTLTLTPTPTVTPTPVPADRYFPLVFKTWPEPTPTATPCVPEDQVVDVAMVIDTSNSMLLPTQPGGERKIDAAVGAGKALIDLLLPPGRTTKAQVTVVWFNGQSQAAISLSGDRAALIAALDSLPGTQAGGTRIDLGLDVGLAQLGAATRPGAQQSLILVTDGEQEDEAAVLAAADRVKAAGIELFAVALGADSDQALLAQVASSPAHFVYAPNAEDLGQIYVQIGAVLPCGKG